MLSEAQLVRAYQHDNDASAGEYFIDKYRGLAYSLAHRYAGLGEPQEDLQQVAILGMLKALGRYNPEKSEFSSFAQPTILGELRHYFRDKTWNVKVPREISEIAIALKDRTEQLAQTLDRAPTEEELAESFGVSKDKIIKAQLALLSYSPSPIEDAETTAVQTFDNEMIVEDMLKDLTPEERSVIRNKFLYGYSQKEIAASLGISQMQVSRIITRALQSLAQTVNVDAK